MSGRLRCCVCLCLRRHPFFINGSQHASCRSPRPARDGLHHRQLVDQHFGVPCTPLLKGGAHPLSQYPDIPKRRHTRTAGVDTVSQSLSLLRWRERTRLFLRGGGVENALPQPACSTPQPSFSDWGPNPPIHPLRGLWGPTLGCQYWGPRETPSGGAHSV